MIIWIKQLCPCITQENSISASIFYAASSLTLVILAFHKSKFIIFSHYSWIFLHREVSTMNTLGLLGRSGVVSSLSLFSHYFDANIADLFRLWQKRLHWTYFIWHKSTVFTHNEHFNSKNFLRPSTLLLCEKIIC